MIKRLKSLLLQDKEELSDAWFESLLNSYPEESRKYFRKHEAHFSNPIGYNLKHSLSSILEELLKDEPDADRINSELQMILRIKGVQDVLPSQAVSFVPALKQTLERKYGLERLVQEFSLAELMDFYSNLDTVGLYAYDLYMESRELIYQLRITQIKETNDLLVKANLLNEELDMSTFMRCSTTLECPSGGSCAGDCTAGEQVDNK